MQILNAPFEFISTIYFKYSVPVRLNVFVWLVTFLIYYILSAYDKRINMDNKRVVKKENIRIPIFVIYTIFLCLGLFVYSPVEHYQIVFDVLGILLSFLGLGILTAARIELNGLWGPHLYEYAAEEHRKIITSGIYKYMRHPIYVGQIVLSTSTFTLIQNLWIGLFCISVFIINLIRAIREEEFLLHQYPDLYSAYKNKTKRWFVI